MRPGGGVSCAGVSVCCSRSSGIEICAEGREGHSHDICSLNIEAMLVYTVEPLIQDTPEIRTPR